MVYEFLKKTVAEKNFKIFSKKFGSLKIKRTFASPFEKRVPEKGREKFIEKTVFTVQEASTEKYNLSRSVNFFSEIISVRTS